jgi:hypothetical protein
MSLAMYAAPFDNDSSDYKNNDNDNIINKKRQTHNKTQKKNPKVNFDQEKVNSVLEKIHNDSVVDDSDDLGSFNPPPNPESSGVNKTIATEEMTNMTNTNNLNSENLFRTLGKSPLPNNGTTDNLSLNNFNVNYGNNQSVEDYYNKMLPVKNINNRQYYNSSNSNVPMSTDNSPDLLIKKLNYMINLLEEQQDERTNNVTEEVVLYSFLGIFIIFVVDSFARVGKYVR